MQAPAELEKAKRRDMYVEMQSICRDDGGPVVPMFSSYVHAATDKLQLPEEVAANWELDGHRQCERWWFA